MYDIVIVGGGPAGATLARMIGNRYKVLLLEKRSFSASEVSANRKSCGGLIAPDAQLMLAKFGLGIPRSVLLSPQLFAVRTIDMDNSIERYYQRHYINVDREEFDKWLESIIPSNVQIINNAVFRSYEVSDDGICIKFNHKGKEYTEKARLLVGADGAFSKVRRQGFASYPAPELYISMQEWFETERNQDYYGAIFDREITDFYSWTIPKEKFLILGSALKPDRYVHEKFILLKNKLKQYGFDFQTSVRREGAYLLRPVSTRQICTGDNRVALVGEAAGFISPSSAEGFSYAFRSALALGKSLQNGIYGYAAGYSTLLKPLKRNIMVKNMKAPAMYNKHLRKVIMKTGLLSVNLERID